MKPKLETLPEICIFKTQGYVLRVFCGMAIFEFRRHYIGLWKTAQERERVKSKSSLVLSSIVPLAALTLRVE